MPTKFKKYFYPVRCRNAFVFPNCIFLYVSIKCKVWYYRSKYRCYSTKKLLLKISQYSQQNTYVGVFFQKHLWTGFSWCIFIRYHNLVVIIFRNTKFWRLQKRNGWINNSCSFYEHPYKILTWKTDQSWGDIFLKLDSAKFASKDNIRKVFKILCCLR